MGLGNDAGRHQVGGQGSPGATALGLALEDKLVELDDPARKYLPEIGTEPPGNSPQWLGAITVRQLATMTAGFDDGRPPKLVYRPGTSGIYSNDTANMLAELLTVRFGEDLAAVLKRRVFDPIGVVAADWRWRENRYRAKAIHGLPSREFASGLTINDHALAGSATSTSARAAGKARPYFLRSSSGRQPGPPSFPPRIPTTASTGGATRRGRSPTYPATSTGRWDWATASWPSARASTSWPSASAPATPHHSFHRGPTSGRRRSEASSRWSPRRWSTPIRSPLVAKLAWAPAATIIRQARDSDNWPLTWADDDHLYTAYGDGTGFVPKVPQKLSLGLARIEGGPDDFHGVNLRAATAEQKGDGKAGRKASGLLMVDGVLYLWVRNAGNAQLGWSADHARTWTWADWKFSQSFGCPSFLNFGKNYAQARDAFVYVYSHDSDSAYQPADRVVLARVPKDRIADRGAYEFFQGLDPSGNPAWTRALTTEARSSPTPGIATGPRSVTTRGSSADLLCQTGADANVARASASSTPLSPGGRGRPSSIRRSGMYPPGSRAASRPSG